MHNKFAAGISLAILLLTCLGCSMLQKMAKVNVLEGDNAAKAAKAIKEKIGGEVRVIRAQVTNEKLELTVRSNKNPKDMDTYTYANGSVSGPEPVQVIQMGNLSMTGDKYQTTEMDQIGWEQIPATIAKAKELSKLENAEVRTLSMAYEHPMSTDPSARSKPLGTVELVFAWRLFVEGPRGRKDFWADKNGKLNETAF